MTGGATPLLNEKVEVEEDFELNKLAALSLHVIEEIADQELRDPESDPDTSLRENGLDRSEASSNSESGRCANDIPIGHDRSTKERSLDVVAVGKDAGTRFEDFQLKSEVLKGLKMCRFEDPSPIQVNAIPHGKFGFDLILQSKSGTGKTCAFGVIILENIDLSSLEARENIQAIVISPTRELACQTNTVIKCIGSFMPGLKVKEFIGGTSVPQSIKRSKTCNIASGTPGRLWHMISAQEMDLSHVQIVVLDEADRLMEASFLKDIVSIFKALPNEKQVIAASATYPDELREFVKRFMRAPIEITTDYTPELLAVSLYGVDVFGIAPKSTDSASENDNRKILSVAALFEKKMEATIKILQNMQYTQAIIFSKFILVADKIYIALKDLSLDVALLTSGLSQETRLKSLRVAQSGKCKILVCSDLGARGIDVEGVDLVINFELPDDPCTFVHRFGRAGRFGSVGTSFTLLVGKNDYTRLSEYVTSQKLDVRRLTSLQDLQELGKSRSKKLKKIMRKEELISTGTAGFENWKETLNLIMEEPFKYPSLTCAIGLQIDLIDRAISTEIEKIEKILYEK